MLECPSPDRTGIEAHLDALPVVNIDHHLGNQHYGEINWVDSAAPAVGEMVYRLAQGLKVDIDADTATALYLTLVTDTGGFRFSNATPAAFEAAASLVRDGRAARRRSRSGSTSRAAGADGAPARRDARRPWSCTRADGWPWSA